MELNQEFLIETFFSYCKRPLHKKYQNAFNAECPVCKEGKSAGKTRRLFYFPNKQYFYCHNCTKAWLPFDWVREVTSLSVPEIFQKNKEKNGTGQVVKQSVLDIKEIVVSDLPENCIDLTDPVQLNFYKTNIHVNAALNYCSERRLWSAINSCNKFYISLEDKIHKNRLVIPFYGNNNQIVCYQTRALNKKQFPKYLTKYGEKELFGLANIKSEIPYVFVFEGPIDSMFVQNGVALAAISPTQKQLQQLSNLIGYEIIYVFDNDKNNKQTQTKIEKHIENGKRIFTWPREFRHFKDFNEMCCKLNLNEISWKFVVKNSTKGREALIKQKLLKYP